MKSILPEIQEKVGIPSKISSQKIKLGMSSKTAENWK